MHQSSGIAVSRTATNRGSQRCMVGTSAPHWWSAICALLQDGNLAAVEEGVGCRGTGRGRETSQQLPTPHPPGRIHAARERLALVASVLPMRSPPPST